jgi:hypothetical protein
VCWHLFRKNLLVRVEGTNTVTLLEGSPSSVPITVFDEVLVSRVTSRPLTSAEISERGISIDESNFRAVEFEVGFVLDGRTFPVRFPVVTPSIRQTTEIIPAAELEERLAEAARIRPGVRRPARVKASSAASLAVNSPSLCGAARTARERRPSTKACKPSSSRLRSSAGREAFVAMAISSR